MIGWSDLAWGGVAFLWCGWLFLLMQVLIPRLAEWRDARQATTLSPSASHPTEQSPRR